MDREAKWDGHWVSVLPAAPAAWLLCLCLVVRGLLKRSRACGGRCPVHGRATCRSTVAWRSGSGQHAYRKQSHVPGLQLFVYDPPLSLFSSIACVGHWSRCDGSRSVCPLKPSPLFLMEHQDVQGMSEGQDSWHGGRPTPCPLGGT